MKIVRYFFVGGVAASVDLAVFALFAKYMGLNYLVVSVSGFVLATFVNYLLGIRFVFRSGVRFSRKSELMLLYFVSAVGLVINTTCLYILVEWAGTELTISKVVAIGTTFFWNYLARKHFIFRDDAQQSVV